ncbi:cytochrome b5 domain-containing protein [Anaeromicropila herbilytica]|uniref:Cytochrome b5 heme-binding domain-containing protein n=1 Tax=Anaeromicropila herbilytica TaxID=2785025 RepID=A0A7R7ENY4_9FIRM|nr:cytochrome b5 domain-containing protein [Anaeromicropila herbilytica]BCN32293.1 hypothetical protein bsdtb5_35880 [Anaeromicropila herbilytica]
MGEIGNLFGWLIVISYVGTMLNYVVKAINRKYGKKIAKNQNAKQIMSLLMKVFVKYHRLFGYATVVFLIVHYVMQYMNFGFNITGTVAAALMIIQVLVGIYGSYRAKKRAGAWFFTHRLIGILLILGIVLHVAFPELIQVSGVNNTEVANNANKEFTIEELAKYDGQNGNKAYVAYKGVVYDVTDVKQWKDGKHYGAVAGTDLTDEIGKSPHGDIVFKKLTVVGSLKK